MSTFTNVFMWIVLILVCENVRGDSADLREANATEKSTSEGYNDNVRYNETDMPAKDNVIVKDTKSNPSNPDKETTLQDIHSNQGIEPTTSRVDVRSSTKMNIIEVNLLKPDRNANKPFNITTDSTHRPATDEQKVQEEKVELVTQKPKAMTPPFPVIPPEALYQLTKNNFDQFVLNSSNVWIVAFYSKSCTNCSTTMKLLQEAKQNLSDENVTIGVVDIEDEKELKERFMISEVPSTKLFYPGDTGGYLYRGPLTHVDIYKASTADQSARIFPSIMDGRMKKLNDTNNFGNHSMALQNDDSGKNKTYLEPINSGSINCRNVFWQLLVFLGAMEQFLQSTLFFT